MLISSEPGERYALGFHGEGLTVVTPEGAFYATDPRYIEAAREQVRGCQIVCTGPGEGHLELVGRYLRQQGLEKIGFESGAVTVDTLREWQEKLPGAFIPAQKLLSDLRASKDEEERSAIRRAQAITDEAFLAMLDFLRPGLTEQQVAARLIYEMMCRGAEKPSFDPIVAAGPDGSRPHAVPGPRVLEKGMFVTMDFGCIWGGYCSDMTRTVALGQPTEEMRQVYEAVRTAQLAGIAAARAGVPGRDVDGAARASLEHAGYGPYFTHGFGHSLGLEIHESPNANAQNTEPLPAGAVISAEPGVYLPGRFGVRIEDVLILEEGGCEDITHSPKELLVL